MMDKSLQPGEIGVLQHMNRTVLNGQIAEVTGRLKRRLLYDLRNPADSEICVAYKVCVPGYPQVYEKVDWCVKAHQIRRIDEGDVLATRESSRCVESVSGGLESAS
jgi:hypothetical protein